MNNKKSFLFNIILLLLLIISDNFTFSGRNKILLRYKFNKINEFKMIAVYKYRTQLNTKFPLYLKTKTYYLYQVLKISDNGTQALIKVTVFKRIKNGIELAINPISRLILMNNRGKVLKMYNGKLKKILTSTLIFPEQKIAPGYKWRVKADNDFFKVNFIININFHFKKFMNKNKYVLLEENMEAYSTGKRKRNEKYKWKFNVELIFDHVNGKMLSEKENHVMYKLVNNKWEKTVHTSLSIQYIY